MYSMVVGFGSIGEQHYESLKEIVGAKNLFIFSRRKLNIDNCISNLNEINLSEFNYLRDVLYRVLNIILIPQN